MRMEVICMCLALIIVIFISTPVQAGVTIKAVTGEGKEADLVSLTDTEVKALKYHYGTASAIIEHIRAVIQHDIDRTKEQYVDRWTQRIRSQPEGAETIPVDFDKFVDMVNNRGDYKSASEEGGP